MIRAMLILEQGADLSVFLVSHRINKGEVHLHKPAFDAKVYQR